ncbi:ROK family protein [Nocardia thailandica]|uniref:ROK family protein n=1 Tax=Nocardia thailandica TaxID=257275 RepID=UPI0012F8BEAF|nr:ROK family protein [Nocardia thailandica]
MTNSSAGSVLRAVLELGSAPRSVLARHAGVSPATVTWQTKALVAAGLLLELPETSAPGGVGRPHSPLTLDVSGNVVLAVHIAAAQVTVAVVDIGGTVRHSEQIPHRTFAPYDILAAAVARVRAVADGLAGGPRVLGLGVAIGGRVDTTAGSVIDHAFLRWRDVPVREYFAEHTGLPTTLDSHTRALCHAEHLYGRLRGASSSIVLFVGNVIDAAFAVHGQVHYGPRSGAGGVDRILSAAAGFALDDYGDHALVRRGARLTGVTTMHELITAAARGGPERRLFLDRAAAMGRVAAVLIDLLDPEALVLVDRGLGPVPGVREAYRAAVREHAAVGPDAAEVVFENSFPGQVLVMSAAAVVLREVFAEPLTSSAAKAV